MIEAQASSVISAAETGCVQIWAYADTGSGSYGGLAGMKGETAEGFFLSQERSSGLTQNMRQTVTVVERYLRYRSCEE